MRSSKPKARNPVAAPQRASKPPAQPSQVSPAASAPASSTSAPSLNGSEPTSPTPPPFAGKHETPAGPPRTPADSVSDQMIAARAYEIWERRGRQGGQSEQDWHAAREELEEERLGWAAPRNEDRNLKPGSDQ